MFEVAGFGIIPVILAWQFNVLPFGVWDKSGNVGAESRVSRCVYVSGTGTLDRSQATESERAFVLVDTKPQVGVGVGLATHGPRALDTWLVENGFVADERVTVEAPGQTKQARYAESRLNAVELPVRVGELTVVTKEDEKVLVVVHGLRLHHNRLPAQAIQRLHFQ